MNFEEKLEKYAEACINVGVNLRKGQPVYITSPIECHKFAKLVSLYAYKSGAKDVYIQYVDEEFSKLRFDNAPREAFENCYDWELQRRMEFLDDNSVFISIVSENPEIFKDCDQEKVALNAKTRSLKIKPFSDLLMKNQSQWLVVAVPSVACAKKIYPDLSEEEAVANLWEEILKAVRVDENPVQENWDKHAKTLHEKCKFLNDNSFDKLIFKNSLGTDLEIGLPDKNVWEGGGDYTVDGHFFFPNMPTEEVFGMPHKEKVNGIVKSSKPLIYRGNMIDEFSLTFENGKIIDYSAKVGYETLKGLVETDEGARSIGEVALVPYESPISLSNILFYDTLFDENASCHLAIGRAYPTNLEGGSNMSKEELGENGANDSLVHVDFMFGTSDMEITGIKEDGSVVPIFINGNWA